HRFGVSVRDDRGRNNQAPAAWSRLGTLRQSRRGSIGRGRDYLPAAARAEALPDRELDAFADEPDRAVGQGDVDAARVVAPGGQVRLVECAQDDAVAPAVVRRYRVRVEGRQEEPALVLQPGIAVRKVRGGRRLARGRGAQVVRVQPRVAGTPDVRDD